MAKDRAKSYLRKVLAFKVEDDTGVQEALAAEDATLDAMDPVIRFNDEGTERGGAALSQRKRLPGALSGTAEFSCHLTGSGGASAPPLANLLSCCGLKLTTATLTPLTQSDIGNTGTIGLYQDGRFKSLFGMMSDATFTGTHGKPVTIAFSAQGKRAKGDTNGPRDVAFISPTHLTVSPPILVSATFTIGSQSYYIPGFELALGNTIKLREDITDASGYHAAQVVSHSRRLSISPEALPLSTQDWYDAYEEATEFAWEAVVGSANGNNITITAPKIQLAQPPEDEDREGILADSLVFQLNQDGDAGDDELEIVFDTV